MEIETKYRIGKLPEVKDILSGFDRLMKAAGLEPLSITIEHARKAGSLPIAHKDPFDRFLIAQSICDGLTLVSNEALFDSFGVNRLW
jgi:PIN domain nuclease of toxin-antitoxin system